MTREEAIEEFREIHNNYQRDWAERWVDGFAKLGMLKLDEPKDTKSDKIKALARELSDVASGCTCFDCLTNTLKRHGLKIVEQ